MTGLEVVPTKKLKPIPENMRAAIGWILYKFATESNTEHFKTLALYMAEELGKDLSADQEEMDRLITSYLEEHGG